MSDLTLGQAAHHARNALFARTPKADEIGRLGTFRRGRAALSAKRVGVEAAAMRRELSQAIMLCAP